MQGLLMIFVSQNSLQLIIPKLSYLDKIGRDIDFETWIVCS